MANPAVIEAVESALADPAVVQESLTSRQRWAEWEARHGLAKRGGSPSLGAIHEHGLNEWPKPSARSHTQILKGAADTKQLHAPNGIYSAERKAVHDRIVSHFLAGKAPATGKPTALFMAGGAASGKTHALKASPHLKPKDAVEVNPDEIKEHLPEYQEMLKHGDRAAAAAVHEESSDIAKRLMHEAQQHRQNLLVDGTGDSARGKFADKLRKAHQAGYEVHAMYTTVPTGLAVERAVDRAHRTGRHVPIPEIERQHRNVSAYFHDVHQLPFVKHLEVHDTSEHGKSHKIATAKGGQLVVHDEHRFRQFTEKGRGAD